VTLRNGSNMTISYSSFIRNNSTQYSGGSILSSNGATLSVEASTFSQNSANATCGAIATLGDACVTKIDTCTFEQNTAVVAGGSLSVYKSVFTISGSSFLNNSAVVSGGGALDGINATIVVDESTFTSNTANMTGGVLSSVDSNATIVGCMFERNTVPTYYKPVSPNYQKEGLSSALYFYGERDDINIMNSTFYNNAAATDNKLEYLLALDGIRSSTSITSIRISGCKYVSVRSCTFCQLLLHYFHPQA
jgi:hypothetical protein